MTGSYDETVRLWRSDTGECVAILHPPGPYAGMDISGATGLTEAQWAALRALGAVERDDEILGQAIARERRRVTADFPLQ